MNILLEPEGHLLQVACFETVTRKTRYRFYSYLRLFTYLYLRYRKHPSYENSFLRLVKFTSLSVTFRVQADTIPVGWPGAF